MGWKRKTHHGGSYHQEQSCPSHGNELFAIDEEVSHLPRLKSEPCERTRASLYAGKKRPLSTFKLLSGRESNCSGIGRFSSADCSRALRKYLPVKGPWCVDDMDSDTYLNFLQTVLFSLAYSSLSPIVHMVDVQNSMRESHANITQIHEGLEFSNDDDGFSFAIFSVKFSKDGRELVGNNNESICIYDIGANKVTERIHADSADVNAVTFADESSDVLYSGSDDSLCKVWDRRCNKRGKQVGVLTGHLDGITFIDSRGDGHYFISNCKDQTIKLWDIRKMPSTVKDDSLQKIMVNSAPILPMPMLSSVGAPVINSSQPAFSFKPQTNFSTPFSPAATADQRSAELQFSTQNRYSPNPFWSASTGPLRPFSSAALQSSTPGPNTTATTSFLHLFLPTKQPSVGTQSSTIFLTPCVHPPVELQKNATAHCLSSQTAPCTAHGGILFGTASNTVSVTTSSTPITSSFGPSSFPATRHGDMFSPYYSKSFHAPTGFACQENVFSNSAAYTSINADFPKNTIDLLLPNNIRLVRIRFSSTNDGDGNLASEVPSVGHHDAKASETPISLSIYPGENQELTIKSIGQPGKSHTGKQSSPTGESSPDDQSGNTKVCNSVAGWPSSGPSENQKGNSSADHKIHRSPLVTPRCEVIAESVLPRLYTADYYTVPSIVELAVRESDEPGYCSHVKGFTVGRHGYGSVKFDGETDVRKLDIGSIVEFNEREIIVYKDVINTPPIGHELNKPAEVTLLNVKCVDQKNGLQFTEGPAVDRYKEILLQWTKDHGAGFVSFDAAKGEWTFRVKNFNM